MFDFRLVVESIPFLVKGAVYTVQVSVLAIVFGLVLGWMLGLVAVCAPGADALTPEETVRRYLQVTKDGKFADAYDLVSAAMKRGKDREFSHVRIVPRGIDSAHDDVYGPAA